MAKKKLLVVTSEYFHPLTTRLHHMLPLLREFFDIKIVAVTSSSYDSSTEGHKGIVAAMKFVASTIIFSLKQEQAQQGDVIILRCPFPENRVMSHFGHLFESVVIAWLMKVRKLGKGFDVCLAAPVLAGFPTLLAKLPMPIVYEDWDRFEFFADSSFRSRIFRFMENYCIRNSDEVISAGYTLASSAERKRGQRVHCIPNGVNLKLFSEGRKEIVAKDRFGILYVGSISEWSGLEAVIESLPLIISKYPEAKLFIIGTGPRAFIKKLESLAAKLGLSNHLVFMGRKKHEDLPLLMRRFAVGLATFPNTELMQYAFTLKLTEYMAAGLPVIATDVGDAGTVLRKTKCGLLVDYTPSSIACGVNRVLGDADYAELLARNGEKWVVSFDLTRLAREEADILMKLTEKKPKH